MYFHLVVVSLVLSTRVINCPERLVSEMMLNFVHITHSRKAMLNQSEYRIYSKSRADSSRCC